MTLVKMGYKEQAMHVEANKHNLKWYWQDDLASWDGHSFLFPLIISRLIYTMFKSTSYSLELQCFGYFMYSLHTFQIDQNGEKID
jgi:hypothetical protein